MVLVAVAMMVPIGLYGKNDAPRWALLGIPLSAVGFGLIIPRGSHVVSIGGGFLSGCLCAILGTAIGELLIGKPTPPLGMAALPVYYAFRFIRWSYSEEEAGAPTTRDSGEQR
jgi:hypothetical protein